MDNSNEMKISIPKPCHEDWNQMTPNEKGAFCAKCAKTVVDFTKKTTDEIKNFLTEQSGKKICGRFMSDQLDEAPKKTIDLLIPLQLLPKKLSFNKAFVFAVFIIFGTSLFSCSTQQGEVVGKISPIDTTTHIVDTTATGQVKTLTGDTVVSKPVKKMMPVMGGASIHTQCNQPLKGDVAIEMPVKGEVKALPQDTVQVKKDTIKEEIMTGKIKVYHGKDE